MIEAHTINHLTVTRDDGVKFVYDRFSPNGSPIRYLTAGDEVWASVPVGRYEAISDVIQAIEQFVMPPHY